MFSGKKIKEHMESELSEIFQLKLGTKNNACVPGNSFYVHVG